MALPASAGSWKLVKWLVKKAPEAVPPVALYLLSLLDEDEDVSELAWVRAHVRFSRATPTGTVEDYAQFKLDLMNITSGAVDTSWTAGDFSACTTAITTFLTTLQADTANSHTAKEIRYYAMAFNPSDPGPGGLPSVRPRPFMDTGPPLDIATLSIAGGGSTRMAYQVATTVTLKTAWPKHWGRIYLPGPSATIDSTGRLPSVYQQKVANAFFDLNDDLSAAGFLLQVPVGQVSKQRFHALLGLTQVVVDDIPDVVRRRRAKQAFVRAVGVE